MMEIKNIIENVTLFNGLSDIEIKSIIDICRLKKFAKGSVIFKEHEEGDYLLIVGNGRVSLYNHNKNHNRDVKIAELGQGQTIGEMALVDVRERSATVIADEDTEIIYITAEDLNRLLTSANGMAFVSIIVNIARVMSERLRKANKLISEMADSLEVYRQFF